MNKILFSICALFLIASCTKKEEESHDDATDFAKYTVVSVQNGGSIAGRVMRTDSAPYLRRVSIQRDQPACGDSHPNPSDPGQSGVRGCIVWLEGIKEGKGFIDNASKPMLEQKECTFLPHVQVLKTGGSVIVTNDDDALHNYHVTLGTETVTNEAQPGGAPPHELTLKRSGLHQIVCDVHPWMRAFIYTAEHPYYTVSDSTGAFTFTDVPPGTYTIKLWRDDWRIEELKNDAGRVVSYRWKPDITKEASVTVTAGQEATVGFSLP